MTLKKWSADFCLTYYHLQVLQTTSAALAKPLLNLVELPIRGSMDKISNPNGGRGLYMTKKCGKVIDAQMAFMEQVGTDIKMIQHFFSSITILSMCNLLC